MSVPVSIIYHLSPADYWRGLDPAASYLPGDFEHDGFIHCTRGLDLLLQVANTFYRDAPCEFLLLVIEKSRVSAEIKYEGGFPHIYGPLNRDAIVAVHTMGRYTDGCFELPIAIAQDESQNL